MKLFMAASIHQGLLHISSSVRAGFWTTYKSTNPGALFTGGNIAPGLCTTAERDPVQVNTDIPVRSKFQRREGGGYQSQIEEA